MYITHSSNHTRWSSKRAINQPSEIRLVANLFYNPACFIKTVLVTTCKLVNFTY